VRERIRIHECYDQPRSHEAQAEAAAPSRCHLSGVCQALQRSDAFSGLVRLRGLRPKDFLA
jgi:hypothetical protein